jgi:hypothetical protein
VPRRRRWRSLGKKPRFLPEAHWDGQGATHASHGWPWRDAPGLRGAGTAQRNARIQCFMLENPVLREGVAPAVADDHVIYQPHVHEGQ